MIKKIIFSGLLFSIVLYCSCGIEYAFSGGAGTKDDPYIISTTEDILDLSNAINLEDYNEKIATSYFEQSNNIDMENKEMSPIGTYSDSVENCGFKGYYNGNNYSIKNVGIKVDNDSVGSRAIGLFGCITDSSNIHLGIENLQLKNLKINHLDDTFDDASWAGGLVGFVESTDTTIKNCSLTNLSVNTNYLYTGGLVGENNGHISDCNVASNIVYTVEENLFDLNTVGGFVGENNDVDSLVSSEGRDFLSIALFTFSKP